MQRLPRALTGHKCSGACPRCYSVEPSRHSSSSLCREPRGSLLERPLNTAANAGG